MVDLSCQFAQVYRTQWNQIAVAAQENGLAELIIFGQKETFNALLGQAGRTKKGQGRAPHYSTLGETIVL